MEIYARKKLGYRWGKIMIAVGIVGLLAGLALPRGAQARDSAWLKSVCSNLRILEAAKEEWAVKHQKGLGTMVDNLNTLSRYFHQGGLRRVTNEVYQADARGTPPGAEVPGGVRVVLDQ
jgi:hypothetical protein